MIRFVDERAGYLLLIDTCGVSGSVALAALVPQVGLVAEESLPGRSASELLVARIRGLLGRAGTDLGGVAAIAVVHGPGSFTGIRVGLSAAKGLSEAGGIPLIAISRLAVLAALASRAGGENCLALLDAGRGEFYAGRYVRGECQREVLRDLDEVREMLTAAGGVVPVVCETVVSEALPDLRSVAVTGPKAGDALGIAARRFACADFDDPVTLDANYVRRTDLEIFAKPARLAAFQR